MHQSVAAQRHFGLELLAAGVTQVTLLCAVSVHVGLQVALAATGVVAQGTLERLHSYPDNQFDTVVNTNRSCMHYTVVKK